MLHWYYTPAHGNALAPAPPLSQCEEFCLVSVQPSTKVFPFSMVKVFVIIVRLYLLCVVIVLFNFSLVMSFAHAPLHDHITSFQPSRMVRSKHMRISKSTWKARRKVDWAFCNLRAGSAGIVARANSAQACTSVLMAVRLWMLLRSHEVSKVSGHYCYGVSTVCMHLHKVGECEGKL